MLDLVISYVRTTIPAWWGAIVVWLTAGDVIDPATAEQIGPWAGPLTGAALALATLVVYALARWIERGLPGALARFLPEQIAATVVTWLVRLLLGSTRQPTYSGSDPR